MMEAEIIRKRFLKALSKIKGWHYDADMEREKSEEIKEFIQKYILNKQKIRYSKVAFLVKHPCYIHSIIATTALLELSQNEGDFDKHFKRVTANLQLQNATNYVTCQDLIF